MSGVRTCYISGPITGTTDYHERFAAGCLEVAALGYSPVDPRDTPAIPDCDWLYYMKADIRLLLECDSIYCLRGWENSRGARLERLIADGLGMEVLLQPELPTPEQELAHYTAMEDELIAEGKVPPRTLQEDNNTNE